MPDEGRALPDAPLGPYDPAEFRLATGASAGKSLIAAARYLFESETIAVPVKGPFAGFAEATRAFRDLAAWGANPGPPTKPPLVWIAAAERIAGARIAPDGLSFEAAGKRVALALVPKIALNRSWANASTFAYLSRRTVTMRGETGPDGRFVARTIWPEDWRLDEHRAPRDTVGDADPEARDSRVSCAARLAAASIRRPKPIPSGNGSRGVATGPAARSSRSSSTARKATTTRPGAGISPLPRAACPVTGASRIFSSPISTRSRR